MKEFVHYHLQQTVALWDVCSKVTNIAFQSELFLRAWRYGAGLAIRHYLPDYLSLCAATFPTMSLVHALILPMPHEDLKRVFFKFATARQK